MAKKSKNPLILVGVIVVLVLVGVFVYAQQKDEPTQNQPTTHNCKNFEGKEHCADNYIGLSESDAVSKAQSDGLTARVVESDENPDIISTSDRQDKRINFTIANGAVTKAEFY